MFSWLLFGCSPSKPALKQIFVNGAQAKADDETAVIHILPLGQIEFPSGKVCPKDTMMLGVEGELDRAVPTSAGIAEAAVAKFSSGDERIAFLRVQFRPDPIERYILAIRKIGTEWHESYREAYPVDSGFGGFVDHAAQAEVNELLGAEDRKLTKQLHVELERQSKPTWSCANLEIKAGLRMLVVSSGFGDGGYRTFFGLNSKDEVVSLITDFNVVTSELSKE